MTKNTEKKTNNIGYSFYSRVLEKPFESLSELSAAEAKHFEALKAKEAAAAQKKTDALKVEAAFKALNAARKTYKEELTQLTKEYAESLDNLKKAFELGKKDIHNQLAEAEEAYQAALKEFDTAHPEGYHVTLHDGDFETTLSKQTSGSTSNRPTNILDILDIASIFGL